MAKVQLTEAFIKNSLTCPEGKRKIEYRDTQTAGLLVEVSAANPGVGTYYLRYRNDANQQRAIKLGRTDEISLRQAKTKALAVKSDIAKGADPRADQLAQRAVPTFRVFMEQQYMPHAKAHKRSWDCDERMLRNRLYDEFGYLPLNKISRKQIQDFHMRLKDEGLSPATADHHVKLIRRAFNLGIEWEVIKANPAARIKLFHPDNRVENYMDDKQLQALLQVLRTNENRAVCSICLFLLSTGARVNEALTATWKNVDIENRVWRIPALNSKSKKIRSVPLNDAALEVINQLKTQGRYEYLFVNTQTGQPYTTITKVWRRLREKAGLPHLRLHDLRHQFASFLVNSGRSLYEVQQVLGHSNPIVTQRYAHLSSQALQGAANSASQYLMQKEQPKPAPDPATKESVKDQKPKLRRVV